jgi:intermembrane space import and assembly protein 40
MTEKQTETLKTETPDVSSVQDAPQSTSTEEGQSAAYNPETGEINWDCPCLGGMAHGPCGEEFKVAFSCFVYSEAEPKGMDCVDAFKAMQECFRRYPEYYADELADDEEELEGLEGLEDEFWQETNASRQVS